MQRGSVYARDGIAFPIRVIDAENARSLADRYYRFQGRARSVFGREIHIKPHLVAPWIHRIATSAPVLDAVQAAIGPDVLIWSSDFFNKRAGSGKHVAFHQDSPYWGLEPAHGVVSAWIALTPSRSESGCMQVIKGTHDRGILSHETGRDADNMLQHGQQVVLDFTNEDITDVELEPGQMSIHHFNLIHGGRPNESDHDRIGLVLRCISPDTRQTLGRDSAMLVRGQDRFGHFELEEPPRYELGSRELALLQRVFDEMPSGFGGYM